MGKRMRLQLRFRTDAEALLRHNRLTSGGGNGTLALGYTAGRFSRKADHSGKAR